MKSPTSFLIALAITMTSSAFAAESVHDFKMQSLEGKEIDLAAYKGKVLLIVNTASRCGATPQYEQLQALHEKYKNKGLVVLGFPCNQFGAQEPGNSKDIREFCTENYSVEFPLFSKIDVNGDKQAPLYEFLKKSTEDKGDVKWNFEKFVVGKDGEVSGRFRTRTRPDAPEVVNVIKTQLEE